MTVKLPARRSHTRSLRVQHLDQQVVAGHLAAQVHVAQVVLGLRAEGAQLRQPDRQLAELLLELRVGGQGVLQQSPVHLLLDALHKRLVLQQLHICTQEQESCSGRFIYHKDPTVGFEDGNNTK